MAQNDDQLKALELRIVELEKKLGGSVPELTAQDIASFVRVRNAIFGAGCGAPAGCVPVHPGMSALGAGCSFQGVGCFVPYGAGCSVQGVGCFVPYGAGCSFQGVGCFVPYGAGCFVCCCMTQNKSKERFEKLGGKDPE